MDNSIPLNLTASVVAADKCETNIDLLFGFPISPCESSVGTVSPPGSFT